MCGPDYPGGCSDCIHALSGLRTPREGNYGSQWLSQNLEAIEFFKHLNTTVVEGITMARGSLPRDHLAQDTSHPEQQDGLGFHL